MRQPKWSEETYRLENLRKMVYATLRDGNWHTVPGIANSIEHEDYGTITRRIRELRAPKWGSHTVLVRYEGYGLRSYKLKVKKTAVKKVLG